MTLAHELPYRGCATGGFGKPFGHQLAFRYIVGVKSMNKSNYKRGYSSVTLNASERYFLSKRKSVRKDDVSALFAVAYMVFFGHVLFWFMFS